jgi:polyphosphate kinase
VGEVQVVNGMVDLRCLANLPLPDDPALCYPPLPARADVDPHRPMLDQIADGDILLHHPFDDYEATVVRFLREAAADPHVTTIKITLYRAGDPSAVVDALLAAAHAGKKIAALIELKARFDEEHNVGWARALEAAGAHVVYGFVGLKVHAKIALVVRREGSTLRRYAHVSTGNYNTRSGRQYTDLSLFSASEAMTGDVSDLFNALTGSSRPPEGLTRGALVAPVQLLPAVLELIERETRHARAGRVAGIRIKVNGLSDAEVVRALYRASEAGVRIELVVRGICTLRPDVAGRSDTIRVVSVVGRFLEHSRIYRFENAGEPEYFIGSSDLRPRNLRRRVELLVPVPGAAHREQLDRILDLYLRDDTAWALRADGRYVRSAGGGPPAQDTLAQDATVTPSASRTVASTG